MTPLLDVNVLINAFRGEQPDYEVARGLLDQLIAGKSTFAIPELAMSAFVRITTGTSLFKPVTPLETALQFCGTLRSLPHCMVVRPSEKHWDLYDKICRRTNARGKFTADIYLAAMALDLGCEWVTFDRDFARIPGLTWRHLPANQAVTNPR